MFVLNDIKLYLCIIKHKITGRSRIAAEAENYKI